MRGGDLNDYVVDIAARLEFRTSIFDISVYGIRQCLQTTSCRFG